MPRTLLAIATYNESENLGPLIQAILALGLPDLDILVVDDNSPDGTGHLADDLAAAHTCIGVLHRPGKLGLGTATVAAMRHAIEGGYDFIATPGQQLLVVDVPAPEREFPRLLSGPGAAARLRLPRRRGRPRANPAGCRRL